MRISDWSSDVCSSDLLLALLPRYRAEGKSYVTIAFGCTGGRHRSVHCAERVARTLRDAGHAPTVVHRNLDSAPQDGLEGKPPPASPAPRSEEHTSELQSLMRISYAVFCLKKKTKHKSNQYNHNRHTDSTTS